MNKYILIFQYMWLFRTYVILFVVLHFLLPQDCRLTVAVCRLPFDGCLLLQMMMLLLLMKLKSCNIHHRDKVTFGGCGPANGFIKNGQRLVWVTVTDNLSQHYSYVRLPQRPNDPTTHRPDSCRVFEATLNTRVCFIHCSR